MTVQLEWAQKRDGCSATHQMGRFVWTFYIYEHDTSNELAIVDPAGFRRRMCKEHFGTMSQAKNAAREFIREWLKDIGA